jgi:hypothetical protein
MIYDGFREWERRRREDPEAFTRPEDLPVEDVACDATEWLCALMDDLNEADETAGAARVA